MDWARRRCRSAGSAGDGVALWSPCAAPEPAAQLAGGSAWANGHTAESLRLKSAAGAPTVSPRDVRRRCRSAGSAGEGGAVHRL